MKVLWSQLSDEKYGIYVRLENDVVLSDITVRELDPEYKEGYWVMISGQYKSFDSWVPIKYDEDVTGDYATTVSKLYDGKELLGPIGEILFQATGEFRLINE